MPLLQHGRDSSCKVRLVCTDNTGEGEALFYILRISLRVAFLFSFLVSLNSLHCNVTLTLLFPSVRLVVNRYPSTTELWQDEDQKVLVEEVFLRELVHVSVRDSFSSTCIDGHLALVKLTSL